MKLLISIVFFLCFSESLFAKNVFNLEEVPDSMCDPDYYKCGKATEEIIKDYFSAKTTELNFSERVYAGSCYMVSYMYNPDHEHYGYIYLRKNSPNLDFFGEFSFFNAENPYLNQPLEFYKTKHASSSEYQVDFSEANWSVTTSYDPFWKYFMRFKDDEMLLVGFWDNDAIINCRMKPIHNLKSN